MKVLLEKYINGVLEYSVQRPTLKKAKEEIKEYKENLTKEEKSITKFRIEKINKYC